MPVESPYAAAARFALGQGTGAGGMPANLSEATSMVPREVSPYGAAAKFAISKGGYDATAEMSPTDVSLAVFSRSVGNMGEGAKQRMLEYLASEGFQHDYTSEPWASLLTASQKGVDVERQISAHLMKAKGAFAGEVAGGLPLLAMPAAKGTGAVVGGLAGFLDPVGEKDGRYALEKNVAAGAGLGFAGEKIGQHVIAPIMSKIGEAYRYVTGKAPPSAPPLPPDMQARADAIASVPGATPSRAAVTRSPADWTAQAEGAKASPAAIEIAADAANANDAALKGAFKTMRAGSGSPYDQSLAVHRGVAGFEADSSAVAGGTYEAAETAPGSSLSVDPKLFWEKVTPVLETYADSLPTPVKTRLQQLQAGALANAGEIPAASGAPPRELTVGEMTSLWKLINASTKKAQGTVQVAAHDLKDAIAAVGDTLPESQAPAFKLFRDATQQWRTMKQSLEPKPIAAFANKDEDAVTKELLERQVKNSGPGDLAALSTMMKGANPQAANALHDSVLDFLIGEATDNATGRFSGARLKSAMETIGPDRLAAILSPKEMSRLSELMLAAESMTIEPAGTAINRSNTTSTMQRLFGAGPGATVGGAAVGAVVDPMVQSLTGIPYLGPVVGAGLGRLSQAVGARSSAGKMRSMVAPSLEDLAAEIAGQANGATGPGIAAGQSMLPAMYPTFASLMAGSR